MIRAKEFQAAGSGGPAETNSEACTGGGSGTEANAYAKAYAEAKACAGSPAPGGHSGRRGASPVERGHAHQ